jgi:hypothetical protein
MAMSFGEAPIEERQNLRNQLRVRRVSIHTVAVSAEFHAE